MRPLLAAALAAALAGPVTAAPPARFAVIEDEPTLAVTRLTEPVERALREAGAELLSFETVACRAQGADFSCLLPPRSAPPALETGEALVLEDESELAFLVPADAGLAAALRRAAADPASYRVPHSARLREGEADAAAAARPDGSTTLSLRARLGRPLGLRRRTTLGAWYRVRVGEREAAVLVLGRLFGGVGRLAAAAAREGAAGGAWTGVARGGTFGGPGSDARGRALLDSLERAGLRLSAVGSSELENWTALAKYREERPGGVRFLSANLSAAAGAPFPAYEVIEASGARVALVGLTSARGAQAQAALARHGLSLRDPALALEEAARSARAKDGADAVLVLADLSPDEGARVAEVVGADLLVGHDARGFQLTDPPSAVHAESDRAAFSSPFPAIDLHSPALDLLEVSVRAREGRAEWRVTHRGEVLDDLVPEAEGFPEFPFERFATGFSTSPPLLPSPREVFASTAAFPAYSSRQFWTLAAAMLAERADAEAALLPVSPLAVSAPGEAPEEFVREWLGRRDDAVLLELPGGRLKSLREEALAQSKAEDAGLPHGPRPRFALSGFDARGRVRGAPLEPAGVYRVASSRALADALGLGEPRRDPPPEAATVGRAVLGELRARAGREPARRYADWASGRPVSEPGLWTIDFRDVSLNLRQTKVVRDSDFDPVPNSRIQGFDELLVGGALKTDAIYAKTEYRWTNTVEMEYAKSRIRPRNAPETTNLAANRIMFRTLGTRRAGGVPWTWLARSFGPSLGGQFDGEFESAPGLRRKQIYSVYPGVELFDGSFVRSLELSGNIRRDLSRDPPATQSGLRGRALFSTAIGGATLQGEVWNNYFFLTNQDKPTDLRVEGNANAKLRVPIRKHLWVAPFVDMYWFQLKTKPTWGYSLMTGVSLGFSRLWKPQYEPF